MLDILDGVLPLLSQAEDGRNRVVHASWIGSPGSDKVFFHKPRATRKTGMKDGGVRNATTAEIENVIKSMDSAMKALWEFGCALEKAKVPKTTKMFSSHSGGK
ncbi:MAG: hypothetical protein KF833_16520 [Verrucomicrobiae bacterium]|nr:hypothetical protein [Verrucomicrobiae bacterium]